jgi:hypothetical protein
MLNAASNGTSNTCRVKAAKCSPSTKDQRNLLKQTVSTLLEKFVSGVVAQGTRNHLLLLRQIYPETMRDIEFRAASSDSSSAEKDQVL